MPYFDDNGNEIDPDNIAIPELCFKCEKLEDPHEEILCNLNRLDQKGEAVFKCGSFKSRYGVLDDVIIQ